MFVADRAHSVTGGRGVLATEARLEVLAGLEPTPAQGFAALADALMTQAQRLSGCLCILLQWGQPRRALVAELRALGLQVQVLLVVDGKDAEASGSIDGAADLEGVIPIDVQDPRAGLTRLQ